MFRHKPTGATNACAEPVICVCHYGMALVNKNLAHRGVEDSTQGGDGGNATITPQTWAGHAAQICQVANTAGDVQYFSFQ